MTLLRDLIDIPEIVTPGDLVMELASGIDDVERTIGDYVVTAQLAEAFGEALDIVASSAQDGQSRATYLHGSFGSGKSHFMAVLNLLLRGEPKARQIPQLHRTISAHDAALAGSNWLLVPYHMLGRRGLEEAILGGYAAHVARLHPEAPEAPVFRDREILENASQLRGQMGDDTFFAALSEGDAGGGFGKYSSSWTAATYDAAAAAAPTDPNRERLVGALLRNLLPSYRAHHVGDTDSFLDLDAGLAAMTRHAKSLDYTGIVLFLDELVLWLASKLQAEGGWAQTEASKVAKLRESGDASRALPIVSFVARQRDLRDFIGKGGSGAEQAAVADTLEYGDGRFSVVPLQDQNLPEIARQRVLAPSSPEAAAEIDRAFAEVAADTASDRGVLLTSTGTLAQFRDTYPFTPALMAVLVALSSALQRNRTALRVLKELLSQRRDELTLGDIVGVGEIWDVIMESPEPFGDAMRANAEQAQRLYREKLRPLLLADAGLSEDEARAATWASPFRANDRLVKTLLIAALVPEVEPLRNLTASRLAALNHGSIKTRIAGKETAALVRRLNGWARTVGELKLGQDPNDPTVSIALSGVDVETIIELAKTADTRGAKRLKIRELIFQDIEIDETRLSGQLERAHVWRGIKRNVEVRFGNVRDPSDITDGALRPTGDGWCVVLDFPFDEANYSPADDRARLDDWATRNPEGAKTICWIPSFFSSSLQDDLGRLVIHDHVLAGDGFRRYAEHLSETERHSARQIITNQRDALLAQVKAGLLQAYGLARPQADLIDTAILGDGEAADVISLLGGFTAQRPVGAGLREGFEHLVAQALKHEFPEHPELRAEPTPRNLTVVADELLAAVPEPGGRREITGTPTRLLLGGLAEPLGLGRQSEVAFVLGDRWPAFLTRALTQAGGTLSVGRARELLGDTELAGLPAPLQNLVLVVATEQLGRRFSDHGGAANVTIARLDDHLTIVEQPLPAEDVWAAATQRAQSALGLTPNPLRSASAVGTLSEDLISTFNTLAPGVTSLPDRLALKAKVLGLADAGQRATTASAALALLESVRSATDGVARIAAFASFPLPAGVTDQTLGRSLKSAAAVADVLGREGWTTIEQLAIVASEDADASTILETLRTALVEDEFVVQLEPRFTAALRDGAALLRQRLTREVKRHERGGREQVIGVAAAKDVLDRLTTDEPGAAELSITIAWEPKRA